MDTQISEFHETLKDNWDAISPIFKFSSDVRKVIYTTNAIESLNSTYRRLNRQRSIFPSDTVLLKALYLDTFEAIKDGLSPSETGVRSTVNWVLCMKDGFRNKKNCLVKTGGKAVCYHEVSTLRRSSN